MKFQPDYQEVSVELSPLVVNRLKESSLGRRTLAQEAVRMLRYALRQMFPPRTPDEWRHVIGKEDWKELLQTLIPKSKDKADRSIPSDQPYKMMLEVPSDMMARIEEIARFKGITVSEATAYTIEYALTEVFPRKTTEELDREIREAWRGIFRTIWNRS